jgi:hypothetical protein
MTGEEGTEPTQQQAANGGGESGTYTPPASQADLDRIIADRLSRERGKYADYEELKNKASKFDEVEAANQTELQKATARAEAAEQKAAEFEQERQIQGWKGDIAKSRPDLRDLLTERTEEGLKEQFQALAERIPDPTKQAEQPRKGAIGPYVPTEGKAPATPLNSDALENALRAKLGIS